MEKKSKAKIAIDIGTYVLIALVLFIAFIFLSVAITSRQGTQVPSIFGTSVLTVQSDSMKGDGKDNFSAGDLVTIKRLTTEEAEAQLELYDIITFEFYNPVTGEKDFNTHRIVEIGEAYGRPVYTTRGDNNPTNDTDPVPAANIIGVYTGHIPLAGFFIDFLRSGPGFFILIIIPLLFFFAYRLYILIKVILDLKVEKQKAVSPATGTDFDELSAQRDRLMQERERLEKELEEMRVKSGLSGKKPPTE